MIDFRLADKLWEANARRRPNGHAVGNGAGGESQARGLAAEQAALIRARRERIEFDMEKERGEWLKESEVVRAAREQYQRHRDQLQILPHRFAHLLHMKDAREIEKLLAHEIRVALEELARGLGVPAP